ncbi:hypothetical protein RA276_27705, partial [Pseudomonas syringae pv. tagetis]|uniref:hypothetical protein n=1 Tax=Pseudomonas syringae group genomosp. 7 TaxID=251699 RepID=UPI00377052C4
FFFGFFWCVCWWCVLLVLFFVFVVGCLLVLFVWWVFGLLLVVLVGVCGVGLGCFWCGVGCVGCCGGLWVWGG